MVAIPLQLSTRREIAGAAAGPVPYAVRPEERTTGSRDRGIEVERYGDLFVVADPAVGALSVVDERDLIALHLFARLRDDRDGAVEALARFVASFLPAVDAAARARELADRFVRDGWSRTALPAADQEPLHTVYFTVTRRCDLACPYCYQGLRNRGGTEMDPADAESWMDKIAAVNSGCKLIVTGGEPLSHPRITDILTAADRRGFPIVLLTNGTHIDPATAEFLAGLEHLLQIQMSLDGITEETHGLTRGRRHFPKAMRAFESIVDHALPFVLAPTMHDGNLHELYDIAALAIANGGWCSPNNLREFPHPGLDFSRVQLSNDRAIEALAELNTRLVADFGLEVMAPLAQRYKGPSVCSVTEPNSTFICGMAHSLMDLDWNGDVYPCHLTKDPGLILGNLHTDDFDDIFRRVAERGIRVRSDEIPKCSGCTFVSTCGGGCRAGAFFAHGSLAREDGLCDLNHSSKLSSILVGATARYPDARTGV